jgi:hypothetical protein
MEFSHLAPSSMQEEHEESNDATKQKTAADESESRVQPLPELVVPSNVPPTHVASGKVYEYPPTMPMPMPVPMPMPYGHAHIMNTPSGALMTYG